MANTSTKTTNKIALQYALDNLPEAPADIREKWANMIAQLDKKNAAPKKLTAQQEKNGVLSEVIVAFLTANAPSGFTCSDLLKSVPELEGDSNQHVSALMRQLVTDKRVEKYEEKRRTYFRVAE